MENLTTKLGQKGLIKRHEFIRVIIQCLYSLGYGKSAACLESESSVLYKSAEFKLLESQILSANWDDCVDNLYGFTDLTDETRASTLFLVFKQCLLEFLSRGDYSMALALLRKQISTLKVGKEKVHKLAFGMLLRKEMELGKMDDHIIDELRKGLLRKLEKVLPPPISFPERRLEHLVEMAVSAQIDSCMYHNSTDAITIYEDHNCGRDQIPTETIQVRFHPLHPEILASGSLDHEVRLWNSSTSECIGSRDFYRPIASIAFHAEGELLAVASGHKLYLWNYNRSGEPSSPTIVLKTRRSLRAVHFHPHAAPLLLTAEVNDLDSSDSSVARATSLGCLHYPPPSVFLANVRPSDSLSLASELPLMSSPLSYVPSIARDYSRTDIQVGNLHTDSSSIQAEYSAEMQLEIDLNSTGQYDQRVSPTDVSPAIRSNAQSTVEGALPSYYPRGMQSADRGAMIDVQLAEGYQPGSSSNVDAFGADSSALPFISQSNGGSIQIQPDRVLAEFRQNQFLPSTDPTCWELPFLQGWLMGQRQAGMPSMPPHTGGGQEYSSGYLGDHPLRARFIFPAEDSQGSRFSNPNNGSGGGNYVPMISRIHSDLAASITATAAAELPCTVKLRIWPHNLKNPCASLNDERCLLTVPHAVLCSEMGAHFSPCGRFLAACVACVLPETEADLGLLSQFHNNATEDATSPTRHPISARQVMYELRIYSLEDPTFGSVLVSRAIRAAHCLTSIQFSPTSEHLLLAYGRRHSSLLKSIVVNEETSLPIYTVLEVYRVSNLELVSILPSAEDEVNVACFHPLAGGGLAYGTKEGKLRVLQYDGAHDLNHTRSNILSQKNLVQVQAYALEC